MYTSERKMILGLISDMAGLHKKGVGLTGDEAVSILTSCQQAAMTIGNFLDGKAAGEVPETAGKMEAIVHQLEDYCEAVYQLAETGMITEETAGVLDEGLADIEAAVKDLPLTYKVVFFPYKAAMWDSLESIYKAAAEDPSCEAMVVPIPYFEKDTSRGEWISRYEGSSFPKDIPVFPYNRYDLEKEAPDVAYIHNPYDDGNRVTSVHPDYYSFNLKKYVKKLVYVPYYVTSGPIFPDHQTTSVTKYMDYAVVQSEYAKESCREMTYYDRILPLGSPKIDRVIAKCKGGVEVPAAWREIIHGRKTLMLNTSLNNLLNGNGRELTKIGALFDRMASDPDICLIWRPHPLYESTIRSMRPNLLDQFLSIKNNFIEKKQGVYDDTPDISDTVAIADGYIGADSSSVVNLFGAAGKPVFLFNDFISGDFSNEEKRTIGFSTIGRSKDGYFAVGSGHRAVYALDPASGQTEVIGATPDPVFYGIGYGTGAELNGKIYLPPVFADDAAVIDPAAGRVSTLGMAGRNFDIHFWAAISAGKSVFFIPDRKFFMPEFVPQDQTFHYHQEVFAALYQGLTVREQAGLINGWAVRNGDFYLSNGLSNRIAKITGGTGKNEILYLGQDSLDLAHRIVLKGATREGLWLEEVSPDLDLSSHEKKALLLAPWTALADRTAWKRYDMPEAFDYDLYTYGNLSGVFGRVLDAGKYVISLPGLDHRFLRIDRESGEIIFLGEEYMEKLRQPANGYEPTMSSGVGAYREPVDGHILLQVAPDNRLLDINVESGEFSTSLPMVSEATWKAVFEAAPAFGKRFETDYFAMRESRFHNLTDFLEGFRRDGWAGIRETQLSALSTLAANLDGTCGEKTHAALMEILRAEDA